MLIQNFQQGGPKVWLFNPEIFALYAIWTMRYVQNFPTTPCYVTQQGNFSNINCNKNQNNSALSNSALNLRDFFGIIIGC
jgi:hypothetical protein